MCKIIGIDISKQTFDVCFKEKERVSHKVYDNVLSGFKKFSKLLEEQDLVVMEASGPYYVQLTEYLHSQGMDVCVVNPLIIRRYGQMQFYRAKTDKKDAEIIMEYGYFKKEELTLWQPESTAVKSLKQMRTALELLNKQHVQSKRQLEAFSSSGFVEKEVEQTLKTIIRTISKKIGAIEKQMLAICKNHYQRSYDLLTSIPGIGPKSSIMLIAIVFHSDRGIQYASHKFTSLIKGYDGFVKQSMSRKGNCWDNAVAESFFKSLKVEWGYGHHYKLRSEAELSIFTWIETWYNNKIRHSFLGYKTLIEFELDMYNQKLAA
ncbi:transposase [Tamlana crocina]|uniref:Transposase n=1 Tax=Tamlana crocina TaxID=393006 RepID=A0ABX1DFB4_9FLAO|nr:transposase [Tamlana crocina]